MYVPKYFKPDNSEEVKAFIRANNFGILVSEHNNRPWATHIPFMLNQSGTHLTTHISRGNQQWKSFSEKDVMAIFQGPHAYVSSSWYDHENVPTWNYMAAHVYGKTRIIEGDELRQALRELVDHHEAGSARPVSLDSMTPSYVDREIKAIVGLQIEITEIQAAYKLSQNRDSKNHQNIIDELERQGYPGAVDVAAEMKKRSRE
ncbi:MAG: FMN-binding negative transcriptional regulator [Cyclobacteriaceae bacterium]|nr:FMN-binding negative transcriptional regulator [Cyclobacteriaceae bacterium]